MAKAQFNFSFPLTSADEPSDFILGGSATLTANGVTDPVDNGWLRLTPDQKSQKGWACINQPFAPTLGLFVQFEYKTWSAGGSDAVGIGDGLSVFLYDGGQEQADFEHGGYLGYITKKSQGLKSGYLGIGLDEFGAFSNLLEGAKKRVPHSIALRGGAAEGYPYIAGTGTRLTKSNSAASVDLALAGTALGFKNSVKTRPDGFYRRVRLCLLPVADGSDFKITVELQKDAAGPFYTVIKNQQIGKRPPSTLKIGFGASTGAGCANHEIRNVIVGVPIDLSVETSVDKADAHADNTVTYTTVVSNPGVNAIMGSNRASLFIETDGVTIPADIALDVDKSRGDIMITKNEVQSIPGKHVYDISNLPVGGHLTLKYHGTITRNGSFIATNKATIASPAGFLDIDSSNDVRAASTTIGRDVDLKVVNTVDLSTPQLTGTPLNYITTISNAGPDEIVSPLSATFTIETSGVDIPADITVNMLMDKPATNVNIIVTKDKAQSTSTKQVYHVANFPAKGAVTFMYKGIITSKSALVTNKATIAPPLSGLYETDNSNNSSTITTPLIKDIDLRVVNSVYPSAARNGGLVTYTTVLSNHGVNSVMGSDTITLVIKTDGVSILDDHNDIVTDAIGPQGTLITKNTNNPIPNNQVYDIIHFPAGGSLTLTYKGKINSQSTPGTNVAHVIAPPIYFRDTNSDNDMSAVSTTIIQDVDLQVINKVDVSDAQKVGAILNYTTTVFNLGPSDVSNAILTIEANGVNVVPGAIISKVYKNELAAGATINLDTHLSTLSKYVYHLAVLPAGATVTLMYQGTITSTNHSAIIKATITPPASGFYEINYENNISVAQTLIKPTLTQPQNAIVCSEQLVNRALESDNPSFTSYTWVLVPSSDAIHVHPSSTGGAAVQCMIKNEENDAGSLAYIITPAIKAPIMPIDGGAPSVFTTIEGDPKVFTVTIKPLPKEPSVSVTNNGVIRYREDAVFTPVSHLPSAIYHWYDAANKTNPIKNGVVGSSGVLTVSNLLPGTYTYYVTVLSPDFCEGVACPAKVTVMPMSAKGKASLNVAAERRK